VAKEKKEEAVPDYTNYPKLKKGDFADMVREQGEVSSMMSSLKVRHKELGDALTAAMIVAKAKKVMVDSFRITCSGGRNSQIDGARLLARGVASDVIVACTVIKTYNYVVVKDTSGADATGALVSDEE